MSDAHVRERILPILESAYGQSVMVDGLATELAERIEDHGNDWEARERMIWTTCWNWFSGGGTATRVAADIEAVLTS